MYPTSTEHHKLYPYTSVMASPYSCDPTGAIDCSAVIEQIKANQSNIGTIYFPHGTYKIATNITFPVGMFLDSEIGATLVVSSAVTINCGVGDNITFTKSGSGSVAFNAPVIWSRKQRFTGFATGITFGPVAIEGVLPEWWGATNNGVDCDAAIQSAVQIAITSPFPPLVFQAGYYRYTSSIAIPSTAPVTIRGAGEFSTYLYQCNGTSTDGAIYVLGGTYSIGGLGVGGSSELFWPEGTPKVTLKDFTVLSNTGPALRLKNCSGIQASNVCPYRGGTGYPIMDVNGTAQSQFRDMWIGHSNLGPTPYTFPDTVTALYSLRIISDGVSNPRNECTELDWTNVRVGSGLVNGGSAVFIQNADAAAYGLQVNLVNLNAKATPTVKALTVDSAIVWLTNGYLENTSGTADTVEVLTTYGNALLSMNNVQLPGVIKVTESGGYTINLKLHQTRYPRLNCVTALDTLKVTSCEFAQDPYTTSPLYINSTHLVWNGNNYNNWQSYTPVGIVGWAATPTVNYYYRKDGGEVEVAIEISGTSDSATTTCPLPYPVASIELYTITEPAKVKNNGTFQTTPGLAYAIAAGSTLTFYKDWNSGAFTASGTKQVNVKFKYLTSP